jgi:hypothetical protein
MIYMKLFVLIPGGVNLKRLSLRFSAYLGILCVYCYFNAEVAEVRREPQR